jgi:hypothetical protein
MEVSQVFKTHPGMTQDEERIPEQGSENEGLLTLLHRFFSLF